MHNPKEVVDLIRELFVCRSDVFASFYVDKKIWFPLKDKENGGYVPLTDSVIMAHIKGDRRIGVYSTNPDHKVKWVAADFDDNSEAFNQCLATYKTLKSHGLDSHMELSNSGKGYHLWIFFQQEAEASEARRLMLSALKLANVPVTGKFRKGDSNARAMDRLIPTQDKLPVGGLGNLISMPLNGEAAKNRQSSLFVDGQGEVLQEQIAYLKNVLEKERVDILCEKAQEIISLTSPANQYEARQYEPSNTTEEMLRGCQAIQDGIDNANMFDNFTWMGVLTNIAVLGSAGRELAHDFSKGYYKDAESQYSEDETDRIYFAKVDYIQRGGHPTSCKRLAQEGWECPRILECTYKHPASYGKKLPVPNEYDYSSQEIFNKFVKRVMNTGKWRERYGSEFFMEGMWLDGEFTPYESPMEHNVLRMLFQEEVEIEQFDEKCLAKFTIVNFLTEEEALQFSEDLGRGIVDSIGRVWIFHDNKINAVKESLILHNEATKMGYSPISDPYLMDRWVISPFGPSSGLTVEDLMFL